MKLERIIELGAMAAGATKISTTGIDVVSLSDVVAERVKSLVNKIVVLDNYDWVATLKGKPPLEAKSVYSSTADGEFVGCFKKTEFLIMQLVGNELTTIKKIKFKEELLMDNTVEMLNAFANSGDFGEDAVSDILGDTTDAPTETTATVDKKALAKAEATKIAQELNAIKQQVSDVPLADRTECMILNKKLGRLVAFCNDTEDVVKVSLTNVAMIDPNGKPIIDPQLVAKASPENREKWQKSGKYPKSVCKTNKAVKFVNSSPSQPKAVIVKLPMGSEVSISELYKAQKIDPRPERDMVYRILNLEEAALWLRANFGNIIAEDETIVGDKASNIKIEPITRNVENKSTGEVVKVTKTRFRVANDSSKKRSKLLCNTNYIPLKRYVTAPIVGADEETLKALNLNIAACFTKDGTFNNLNDADKGKITVAEDGSYTSTWINNGEAVKVKKYDATSDSDVITEIKLPVRDAVEKKNSPGSYTYKFKFIDFGAEGGPQDRPTTQAVLKAMGKSEADFLEELKKHISAKNDNKEEIIDADTWLKARKAGNLNTGDSSTFLQLAEAFSEL